MYIYNSFTISTRAFGICTLNATYSGTFPTPPTIGTSKGVYDNVGSIGNECGEYSGSKVKKKGLAYRTEIFQLFASL